ncbi:putative sulfonylurea receptor, AAA+ ATPase domain-containing protein [Plasmopara halstedii]
MTKETQDLRFSPAKTSTAGEVSATDALFKDLTKSQVRSTENPLNTAGYLSIATMWWMHPLLRRGYQAPLDEQSVWDLPTIDQARPLQLKFDHIYQIEAQRVAGRLKRNGTRKRPNVNRAIWKSVKETWRIAFVLHVLSAGLILFQPFLIKAILQHFEGSPNLLRISSGYTLAILLGCTAFLGATTVNAGQFLTTRVACNARMICMNSAYRKILRLTATARRTMDMGEIVTFVGVDCDRVLTAYKLGMWCTISPLMLAIVGILIGTQMPAIVALVAMVTITLIMYASSYMSKKIGGYRQEISRLSASRLKVTNEMLQGIRVVKFYSWEGFATDLINDIRDREIRLLRKYHRVRLANTVLMFLAPTLLNLVCFSSTILLGNSLDIPTTFTIVALTNACRTPFSIYADASVALAEAITSTSRLSDFLASDDTGTHQTGTEKIEDVPRQVPEISLKDGDFKWTKDAVDLTLCDINFTLQPGTLTMIVGPVGSGKSSLVHAILGEMEQLRGTRVVHGNIAYASQEPWIQNQTVQENILFGVPYESEHYERVIQACELLSDFQMLEHGDKTEIGERGINLSGGQKARIALARAMYRSNELNLMIFDDPLSALDVHVANSVFSKGIQCLARKTTRILVLNSHYHLLEHADRILVMSNGKICGDGKLMELQTSFPFLSSSPRTRRSTFEESMEVEKQTSFHELTSNIETVVTSIRTSIETLKTPSSGKLIVPEDRLVGSVKFQSYVDYLASSGWNGHILCFLMITLFTIAQVVLFGCDWFLSQWAQGSLHLTQMDALVIYVGIVLTAAILSFGRCLLFMAICMLCSLKIHLKHLNKVLAAPITTFFDITPIGRILNRFSRDLDEVDNPLPYWGLWLALCLFQVASSFLVCAIVNPLVLFVYLPIGYGCWFAAKVYRATARELKRLDGVTRSPFLNLMSETVSGIETIRSFQMVNSFALRCETLLNQNIRVFFLAQVSSRWFDMRTDWFVSIIVGIVAVLAVAAQSTIGASAAALGLSYAAQLSSSFQRMTTLASRVESSMTCFERIAHYGTLDQEGSKRTPLKKETLDVTWPQRGTIDFQNVSMRYRDDLPLVLKRVSFSIASGEKVGICGRTGSGKSSLMSVLFRVVEIPTSGRVLIDGIDIATITIQQLRTHLTIIPQDPMLFSGSLRLNLDPFGQKSDAELWQVLRRVHLYDMITSWGKGLEYLVAEKGENFSVGQRQLLCIARALIRESKVIVMDEATANVDLESDKVIQETMKESFGNGKCTVMSIAHRMETIADSDKILVLDAGEVVEFDTPIALMKKKGGVYKSLVGSGKPELM